MMRKLMSEESRRLFPISRIDTLVTLFQNEILSKSDSKETGQEGAPQGQPNIALASIILGAVEHSLTATPAALAVITSKTVAGLSQQASASPSLIRGNGRSDFPPLEYDVVAALYDKFKSKMKSTVSAELLRRDRESPDGTSRELVKNVSDIVWNSLSRSYMSDKPHLQSLFTYLTGNKLDCFGLALAVVAGCQILGLSDVHLALSEDHGWVVFGPNGEFNAEVTWHGKGNEDKRGQSIDDTHSWLYLKGHPVICTRYVEIAAIVSAINPAISSSCDSIEMGVIQQRLLWVLYDAGHLQRYPMAIGNLADLEEISSTAGRKSCTDLFKEAITVNKTYYQNMHVYPYTYYAAYLYRREEFREVLQCWAEAAQVISHYRHSKLDEEIYKEFLDISKEQLTSMIKKCSTGINAHSLTRDPASFVQLLRFFDGVCLWEESSATPVLHIVWAQCWINAIGKFELTARDRVQIILLDKSEPAYWDPDPCDSCDVAGPRVDRNGNSKDKESPPAFPVWLRSLKMKAVKELLQREKINQPALTLHLTAQQTIARTGKASEASGSGTYTVTGTEGRIRKSKVKDEPDEAPQPRAKRAKK